MDPQVTVNVNTSSAPNYSAPTTPANKLPTSRSFIKTVLLSLITLGIYGIYVYAKIGEEVNMICSKNDGKKTMNYWLLFFIIGPLTFGIGYIVWQHKISNRIGNELKRRNISYNFSAGSFWLWNVLGSLIVIGPLVYLHKFFKASNLMNESYNKIG